MILISGPTGSTGGATARQLLKEGHPIRALAHREDDRSKLLQDLGAEVVYGDLLDIHAVTAAFGGVLIVSAFAQRQFGDSGVLVTAGPTYEDVDPVRYIGNRSSGRMGYAIAAEASAAPGPGGKPLNMSIEVRQVMTGPPADWTP